MSVLLKIPETLYHSRQNDRSRNTVENVQASPSVSFILAEY